MESGAAAICMAYLIGEFISLILSAIQLSIPVPVPSLRRRGLECNCFDPDRVGVGVDVRCLKQFTDIFITKSLIWQGLGLVKSWLAFGDFDPFPKATFGHTLPDLSQTMVADTVPLQSLSEWPLYGGLLQ